MIADLAVVGGGIVGAWTAYLAARDFPDWNILVLDRGRAGDGATAWSAGADFPIAATPGHRELVSVSRAEYGELAGAAARFRRDLRMIYVLGESRAAAFAGTVLAPLRPVTAAERDLMEAMLPGMALRPGERIVTHDGFGAVVGAQAMARALLRDAGDRVRLETGRAVRAVTRADRGYSLADGEGARWEARRLVTATGPWALPGGLAPAVSLGTGARVKRVAALHASVPVRASDPLVYFMDDDVFILPLSDGEALVSFRRDAWDADPDALNGQADGDDISEGTSALAARSAKAAAAVTGGRAFCDLYMPGRLPVVATSGSLPGLAVAAGGSGSGVRLAPGIAARALAAVTSG